MKHFLDWTDDPAIMRKAHGWFTLFWALVAPVAIFLGWVDSVRFVSFLSIWALVVSHWAGYAAVPPPDKDS